MKKIKELISTEQKGDKTLRTYLIDDTDSEPYKVATIDREFELGEKVAVIWTDNSAQYNTGYLKRICPKCDKQYAEKDTILHEFCNKPRSLN